MTDAESTEVPEADAFEQQLEVGTDDVVAEPTSDPEAPEADALEQSRTVPVDDEYEGHS
jgi:hypothetical protein